MWMPEAAEGSAEMIKMFDLAAADEAVRFSPYCWRIRLSLLHKALPFNAVPWRFTDTGALPPGCKQVPTIVDGARIVTDSWAIAEYLEAAYPEQPSLFGGPGGHAHARFIALWADHLNPAIARMVVADIHNAIDAKDRAYFRSSREARFGDTLEQVQSGRDDAVAAFRARLAPLRSLLKQQDWLGGQQPSYADFCAVSGLQWAASISDFALLEPDDPIHGWRQRLLAAYR